MMDNKDKAIKIAQYNKIIQYRESHPKCRYCKYCDYKKPYGYKHYIYYCKIKATQVTDCFGGFCKLYEYSMEDLEW